MSKKGENIYKRKDGRWEARYVKGYTCEGKTRYGSCYGKTYREARDRVNRIKAALLTGKKTSSGTRTRFSDCCDEWLQLNRSKIKASTYVKYNTTLDNHIKPSLGGYPIQTISTAVIEQFSHLLLTEKGLAPKTVRDILSQVKAILKFAHKKQPNYEPIDIIYPKDTKKEMRVLSKEEQQHFVHYLLVDMDACKFGILLSLLTGLRIGEICALRWRDISIPEKSIHVSFTMQRLKNIGDQSVSKTSVIIGSPKSNSSSRTIPLTDFIVALCGKWDQVAPDTFVLTGEHDRFMEPRALQYRLAKYTAACHLEGVHYHVLRHTFATRCVEVGFDIKSLSEVLGHSSPRITLERYVHSSMDLKRENMNKLSSLGY